MDKYSIIVDADVLGVGISRTEEVAEGKFRVNTIKEKCAIDACMRVANNLHFDVDSLILKEAMKCLENSVHSSNPGNPFEKVCRVVLCMPKGIFHNRLLSNIFQNPTIRRGANFLDKISWHIEECVTLDKIGYSSMLAYFKEIAKLKKQNNKEELKKLVNIAIIPEPIFHADLVILHMIESDDQIELYMQSWSFKFRQVVDAKEAILSTAIDKAYVNNYRNGGIFEGVTACIDISSTEKQNLSDEKASKKEKVLELKHKLKNNGGKGVSTLTNNTTHLICESNNSAKFQQAVKRNLLIVKPEWVLDSLKKNTRLDENDKRYRVGKKVRENIKLQQTTIPLWKQFQELILGTDQIINGLIRVHINAAGRITNQNYKEDEPKNLSLPESELIVNLNLDDLESMKFFGKMSIDLMRRCVGSTAQTHTEDDFDVNNNSKDEQSEKKKGKTKRKR
jgi:hypothetical protein